MGTTTSLHQRLVRLLRVGVYVQNDGDYDANITNSRSTGAVGVYVQNDGDYDRLVYRNHMQHWRVGVYVQNDGDYDDSCLLFGAARLSRSVCPK